MLATLLLAAAAASATPSPDDLKNIALSTQIVQRVGDDLWPKWSQTQFAIDLITANGPAGIGMAGPSPAPSFPPELEATFPLQNGVPTIVIGEPQFTASKTPVRWSVTLLHEHFHQWQYTWPEYFPATVALGLSKGSNDGMWMLNYPFPYANAKISAAYRTMADDLASAVDALGTTRSATATRAFLGARERFKSLLPADDYKYFAFQCWQEGTARYTEIAVARLAAKAHAEDPSFLTDSQAAALSDDAKSTLRGVLKRLRTVPLETGKRANFYAIGAGEAMLLDGVSPGWHAKYFDRRMDLSVYFSN